MKIYSDSTVSDFIHSLTCDQKIAFFNIWNSIQPARDKVYVSYDSTNKKC